jgi:hypothetical protein
MNNYVDLPEEGGGSSGGVTSLNSLTGALTLVAGSGITITPAGSSIMIASTSSGGTVTAVGLADSTGLFNITGSPVTTAGTLTLASFKSQAANTFLAAPNGSAGAPTFRLIVPADVPTLNQNTTGTAANITATTNSTLTTLSALSLPGSQVTGNISGNAANITATTNSTLTTLLSLSLPGAQVTGNIAGNSANVTGVVPILNGGTGQTTANAALNALLPSQTGNAGDILSTNGTNTSWIPAGGTGTVTSVSVATTNGFAGTVATPSTTPVITVETTVSGILFGNGTAVSAATAPEFPTLNQNTTGTASNITATSNSTLTTLSALSLPATQVTGTFVTTIGPIDGNGASSNGLSISGNDLYAQSASNTNPGMVNNTTQTFSGNKSINGTLFVLASSTTALEVGSSSQFIFDTVNSAMGINTQPAAATAIDIVNTSGTSKPVQITGYGTSSTAVFRGRSARGTATSPTATQSGDDLAVFSGRGYGASQFAAASTGIINVVAGENFTNTSNLTYLQFETTPTGSVTAAESMRVASTGVTLGPQSASTAVHNIAGGIRYTTNTVTSSYTSDTSTTDQYIYWNSSSAGTITLPTPTAGRHLIIKDIAGNASNAGIQIAPHASEMIEGLASNYQISTSYGTIILTSDGTNWWIDG